MSRANPKLAAAYVLRPDRAVHASVRNGHPAASGFELAFTDNPQLKPERTRSVDAGVEQKLFRNLLLLDATYFYNRYYDLIVTLGGSLAQLGSYQSANLANSRAQGTEFSASLRPARRLFVTGSYTLLGTRILSLDGSAEPGAAAIPGGPAVDAAPGEFRQHGGDVYRAGGSRRDVTGYFRGKTLYEEPTYGATDGLFWNPGFVNVGVNFNTRWRRGVTAYGSLRNALDRHYEEVFGYPSPRLNFVAGIEVEDVRRGEVKP